MKQDLTGRRYGHWTVLGVGERSASNRFRWRCKCDCGREKDVFAAGMISGKTKSCGCGIDGRPCSFKDLSGQRFGRLVAIRRFENQEKGGRVRWLCRCDCGREKIVDAASLRSGSTKSCGCAHVEQLNNIDRTKISHKKHGAFDRYGHGERLYNIWKGMKRRCYNPNSEEYVYYGGRGITICDEWRNDYAAFRSWALENGYDKDAPRGKCTIDRINNNGNYAPHNCRFVDMKTQNENKRKKGTCGRYER